MQRKFFIDTASSKTQVYRHWRNWRTGVIIESIHKPDEPLTDWWDAEFEAVVLFHHPGQQIVFCDPLTEVLKLQPRHDECFVIRLAEFNELKKEYGGENCHGFLQNKLTLIEMLGINKRIRQEFSGMMTATR